MCARRVRRPVLLTVYTRYGSIASCTNGYSVVVVPCTKIGICRVGGPYTELTEIKIVVVYKNLDVGF